MCIRIVGFILFWQSLVSAQDFSNPALMDSAQNIMRDFLQNHNYVRTYQRFCELDRLYPKNTFVLDQLGMMASYVGQYYEAMQHFNLIDSIQRQKVTFQQIGIRYDDANYEKHDAIEKITKLAHDEQVIMINEMHHVPMHRAFTIQLLQKLYDQGYRYFAAETIAAYDSLLQTRGYPLFHSGFYSAEPLYGDLIRLAIQIGYKIIPYEYSKPCPNPNDAVDCQNDRERGQAQNLYDRIFKKDPKAKALIHVGYGHHSEKPLDGWIAMGYWFREITGINPLTIDQIKMTVSALLDSNDYSDYARFVRTITKPTLIWNREKKCWVKFIDDFSATYDLIVCHPEDDKKLSRPQWASVNGLRKKYKISSEKIQNETYYIQAYFADEANDAVPADMVLIESFNKDEKPYLFLRPGNYRILTLDRMGNELQSWSYTMR